MRWVGWSKKWSGQALRTYVRLYRLHRPFSIFQRSLHYKKINISSTGNDNISKAIGEYLLFPKTCEEYVWVHIPLPILYEYFNATKTKSIPFPTYNTLKGHVRDVQNICNTTYLNKGTVPWHSYICTLTIRPLTCWLRQTHPLNLMHAT